MKTKNNILKLCFFFAMVALCCLPFVGNQSFSAQADTSPTISIQMPADVIIDKNDSDLTFVATLSDTDVYDCTKIVWFVNTGSGDNLMTSGITSNADSSVLTITKAQLQTITSERTWIISAKIQDDYSISTSENLRFYFAPITSVWLEMTPNIPSQNISENIVPITLSVKSDGSLTNCKIEWFQKSYANKYTKINETNDSLIVAPTRPGVFTYKVSVDGVFSQDVSVTVNYKSVTELVVGYDTMTDNSSGLDRYIFCLENIDEDYDSSKIKWYTRQNGLMQEGGLTYEFQASSYGTYLVYAVYESDGEAKIISNYVPIEIKVDRTKEILIACGVLLGLLTIGLIVGCIRMVKRDRVW